MNSGYKVTLSFIMCVLTIAGADSLDCWVCIGSDCDQAPSGNYKAYVRKCEEMAACQKVYYIGLDLATKIKYESISRSCSQGPCFDRTDNCTENDITNPGCMVRTCCDTDLCNHGDRISLEFSSLFLFNLLFLFVVHQ